MDGPLEVSDDITQMYSTFESWHIGETGKSEELVGQMDEIEGYQAVSYEDLADFYDMDELDFIASYIGIGAEQIGEVDLPMIQNDRACSEFIVAEEKGLEQMTEDQTYAAGLGDGEIEVRDEELWENDEFQEIVSEWSDWRQNQKLYGLIDARDLQIHQEF
jgi:hypothetical protein